MPEWLTFLLADTSALQLVFWFVAIGFLITVIVKLWPAIRQLVTIVDSVAGLPAFIEKTETSLAGIYHETHKNDGSSVKDAVDRIEDTAERLELGVKAAHDRIAELVLADADIRAELEDTQNPKEHP